MTSRRPLHIGLICTELFDPKIGGFGGFGFAALRLVEVLGAAGRDRVRFTALLPVPSQVPFPAAVHGVPVVGPSGDLAEDVRTYRGLDLDLVIAIDWEPRFVVPLLALPTVPVLVWIRDPRPPAEWDLIHSLRLPVHGPGTSDPTVLETLEPGDNPRRGRSLRWFLASAKATRRPVEVAVPTLGLRDALRGQYGIDPRRLWQLGTPLPPAPPRVDRGGSSPHAVFLGRLDPVKRPWIFWALAQALPGWRFSSLGGARGGAWTPTDGPANLRHLGHVGPQDKADVLGDADVLVNTSIHEGLPVSACEALTAGVALVAPTDVAGVVARFGTCVPNAGGDGLEIVPALADALEGLAADPARRADIAVGGPQWARTIHAVEPFVAQLALLFDALGVGAGADLARMVAPELVRRPMAPPRPQAPMPSPRPDFLVIGAARSGTTFLHEALRRHPGVFVSEPKEPRHFIADGHRVDFSGPYDDDLVNRRVVWCRERYLASLAGATPDQLVGEVSPLYLDTPGAAERIASALPEVRVVVVLRDPAERAHSQWRLQRHWGQEWLSFGAALDAEDERVAAGWSPIYAYRGRGCYGRLLTPYVEAFGRERIHVARFEDLVEQPMTTLRAITAFIGADGPVDPPGAAVNGARGVPRSRFVAEHLRGGVVPRLVGAKAASRLRRWNEIDARLTPTERADLSTAYDDDLTLLEHLTRIDASLWRTPTKPRQ